MSESKECYGGLVARSGELVHRLQRQILVVRWVFQLPWNDAKVGLLSQDRRVLESEATRA